MYVKSIETDAVVIPDEATDLSVYLHQFADCDRVISITGMPCVFGLRYLSGTWDAQTSRRKRDLNSPSASVNGTNVPYNPVPTDHKCKYPVL